jgi:hypothetical protein
MAMLAGVIATAGASPRLCSRRSVSAAWSSAKPRQRMSAQAGAISASTALSAFAKSSSSAALPTRQRSQKGHKAVVFWLLEHTCERPRAQNLEPFCSRCEHSVVQTAGQKFGDRAHGTQIYLQAVSSATRSGPARRRLRCSPRTPRPLLQRSASAGRRPRAWRLRFGPAAVGSKAAPLHKHQARMPCGT